jgi:hypothetical protein
MKIEKIDHICFAVEDLELDRFVRMEIGSRAASIDNGGS